MTRNFAQPRLSIDAQLSDHDISHALVGRAEHGGGKGLQGARRRRRNGRKEERLTHTSSRTHRDFRAAFWAAARRRHAEKSRLDVVDDLDLRDINGRTRSVEEFLDKPSLLIVTSPHCSPCKELYPLLGELFRTASSSLNVLLLSRGATATNRRLSEEHGLGGITVLGSRGAVEQRLRVSATPWAILMSVDGHVFYSGVVTEKIIFDLAESARHPLLSARE